ncbi:MULTISPECIES: DUF5320 domain-containing protein [Caproicibacterium]|jgi:hypothetical protein|uniref:Uncharacterized protein n=1 Tax=Caproicibacterium lactatifermentans TaxID=2666138 RepID=A0A859DNL9_9FIRM|nr:DUF5320 domain-containing protein [Caproicibacterium lactatifermentans]ARP50668.1 hypothetical protein B6259_07145 [Ruminococcaceae bacterium CPB6]MDD4807407.1 DUF5320 domain-containing protein [Oscillospiraceae bacterium]QKN23597.1 hypothetical protein GJQ69_03325 [Caproicibacterium lactatifermentans]QKO29727.1 hypothetical protein GKP14_01040 [Caproicibacterium lactatifermentans]
MPGIDRTGPIRFGSRSGFGRRMRCYHSFERGRGFYCTMVKDTKQELLARKTMLQNSLTIIEEQLSKM